jgi:hypothetical protein
VGKSHPPRITPFSIHHFLEVSGSPETPIAIFSDVNRIVACGSSIPSRSVLGRCCLKYTIHGAPIRSSSRRNQGVFTTLFSSQYAWNHPSCAKENDHNSGGICAISLKATKVGTRSKRRQRRQWAFKVARSRRRRDTDRRGASSEAVRFERT